MCRPGYCTLDRYCGSGLGEETVCLHRNIGGARAVLHHGRPSGATVPRDCPACRNIRCTRSVWTVVIRWAAFVASTTHGSDPTDSEGCMIFHVLSCQKHSLPPFYLYTLWRCDQTINWSPWNARSVSGFTCDLSRPFFARIFTCNILQIRKQAFVTCRDCLTWQL
jgi:hypothetical protein